MCQRRRKASPRLLLLLPSSSFRGFFSCLQTRGQSFVNKPCLGTKALGNRGEECNNIMSNNFFYLINPFDIELCPFLYFPQVILWYFAKLCPCLANCNFHIQPFLIFCLDIPKSSHLMTCIPWYH